MFFIEIGDITVNAGLGEITMLVLIVLLAKLFSQK
jgi:hypothetical protein